MRVSIVATGIKAKPTLEKSNSLEKSKIHIDNTVYQKPMNEIRTNVVSSEKISVNSEELENQNVQSMDSNSTNISEKASQEQHNHDEKLSSLFSDNSSIFEQHTVKEGNGSAQIPAEDRMNLNHKNTEEDESKIQDKYSHDSFGKSF